MNEETIKKAAMEYAEENPWYPGETSYESDIREMEEKFADAYIAGAQWRINSVWHDASEKPNGNNKCLVELRIPGRNPTYKLWTCGWENSFVTRWAYIDDLLPERKEDER